MSEEARQLARCVVVIPALDPDGALPGYAAALLERGAEGVVAVDDGSRPSCRARVGGGKEISFSFRL